MTAMYLIDLFWGVSVLSLGVTLIFASHAIGSDISARGLQKFASAIKKCTVNLLQRPYKAVAAIVCLLVPTFANAQGEHAGGGEANLVLPDLRSVSFPNFFGLNGHDLLAIGLIFCAGGLLFGLAIYCLLYTSRCV